MNANFPDYLSARYIEEPAMATGKRLSKRLEQVRRPASVNRIRVGIERSRVAYAYSGAHRSSF